MTTWLTRCVALLLLVLPFVPTVAGDPDDEQIARLVKQLGSSDYRMRDAATKRLKEIGEPAADALVRALTSNDLETCRRAEAILKEIGEPALDALVRATKSDDVEARRRAEAIKTAIENRLYVEERRLIHPSTVDYLEISADGKRLLTKCSEVGEENWKRDATFRLWDADKGTELSRFQFRNYSHHTPWPGEVNSAALSPCGKRMLGRGAASSHDSAGRLWDATTGKELCKMSGSAGWTYAVCFGPKGKALAGNGWEMLLWDLATGATIQKFRHESWVTFVAYSDLAKLAASGGGYYPSIRLWDLEAGKEVRRLRVNTNEVIGVCFAPDGKRLLSTGMEGTLRIWDVQSGAELKRIQAHSAPPGALATYCAAVFSPDGRRILSGGQDGMVRLWDAQTGKQLRTYKGHGGRVMAVAFFPEGQRIASAGADKTVRIWRAPR